MKVHIVFWYPSKLEKLVASCDEFKSLDECIYYLLPYGLNVLVPKDFESKKTVYVDEKLFTQR